MQRGALWRNANFVNLWGAATVSTFGSLVTRTALPFTAILVLDASPSAIGVLRVAELLPGFVFGLVAGAWVDRLRRKPIMIATDLGRALLIATIPVAAFLGWLGLGHLYVIAALVSVLSVFFDVAYQSFLPSLVKNDELVEANSKLSAAMSVAEASAFSSAGWLIQLLTAPVAMLVDALTFIASAGLVARIREPEPQADAEPGRITAIDRQRRRGGLARGLAATDPARDGRRRCSARIWPSDSMGTVFLLYVNQEVGFAPGILGMIFAVGGVSSFLGAMIAGRLPRFGIGAVMVASLLLAAVGEAFVPLATAANAIGVLFLVGQQIVADSALTVYDINQVSLRQAIAPAHVLGRINASVRVTEIGAVLLGTVVAGYIGETVGLRETLWVGVGLSLLAAVALALSPVRAVRRIPEMPVEVAG